MIIKENVDLSSLTTFGVPAVCERLVTVQSAEDFKALRGLLNPDRPYMVLGGGSNVLFRGNFAGTVIRLALTGLTKTEDQDHYYLRALAGETWHSLVLRTLDAGMPGLENLALIPGTVGAAAVQNIGAYGLEVSECIASVECFDLQSGQETLLSVEQCQFGYRKSLFKDPSNAHLIVKAVNFKLPKRWQPRLDYAELKRELAERRHPKLDPRDIFAVVSELRRRKLPDPRRFGNAGSFFKNPVLEETEMLAFLREHPHAVHYRQADGTSKLSAAWLIDQAGLKGLRTGCVGVWDKQPLVLVNYGGASGEDIYALAQDVKLRVKNCFGVRLHAEVLII